MTTPITNSCSGVYDQAEHICSAADTSPVAPASPLDSGDIPTDAAPDAVSAQKTSLEHSLPPSQQVPQINAMVGGPEESLHAKIQEILRVTKGDSMSGHLASDAAKELKAGNVGRAKELLGHASETLTEEERLEGVFDKHHELDHRLGNLEGLDLKQRYPKWEKLKETLENLSPDPKAEDAPTVQAALDKLEKEVGKLEDAMGVKPDRHWQGDADVDSFLRVVTDASTAAGLTVGGAATGYLIYKGVRTVVAGLAAGPAGAALSAVAP